MDDCGGNRLTDENDDESAQDTLDAEPETESKIKFEFILCRCKFEPVSPTDMLINNSS